MTLPFALFSPSLLNQELSVYIHIPFCSSICGYCDFPRVRLENESTIDSYLDALFVEMSEMGKVFGKFPVSTVYIGGGTPSVLGKKLFKNLIPVVRDNFSVDRLSEFTVELNPDDIDTELLSGLSDNGVDRISIGVQTFHNPRRLGRRHDSATALSAIKTIRDSGFTNFNVDLMFGLPDTEGNELERNLDILTELDVPHISVYGLTVSENSLWKKLIDEEKLIIPDENQWIREYQQVDKKLKSSGYHHYEISNFSKPGLESIHNMVYWNQKNYLGLGSGAASRIGDLRFSGLFPPEKYIETVKNENFRLMDIIENIEKVSELERNEEIIFTGIRLLDGIDFPLNWFKSHEFESVHSKFVREGLLNFNGKTTSLTEKGLFLSDFIALQLIETLDTVIN